MNAVTRGHAQAGEVTPVITMLRPAAVIDAITEYYRGDDANPSPAHTLSRRAADRLAGARQALARFGNAADAAEIVFVRGTTEGINLVAHTFECSTSWAVTRFAATSASSSNTA
jgi:cysteine desulfurase/selenocysteine lyase